MRNYGGLRKKIPLTFWAMLIGTLAITGVGIPLTHYGFAGFLSKDAVIESAWVGSSYAFWLLVVAACITSFYSWRLMFLTFFGQSRAHGHDDHGTGMARCMMPTATTTTGHEPHESPLSC
jgi:NADH-quinone oxidoreductase subunit L